MILESNDIKNNSLMSEKFSYRKQNISPHLKWNAVPKDAKSYALSCIDPDGGNWIHWIVYNIPYNVREIYQGGPVPGVELKNDFGKAGYGGPAPPFGTHRYIFRIYALGIEKLEGITKNNFMQEVKKNALAFAELIGLYKS
jgi:Raf kinase inhibitor-like YbhB/YbcL family protein